MQRSILVVDDEPSLCDLLVDYLGAHGYRVRAVDSGEAMWRALDEAPAELVVLDVNLPGRNGFELAKDLAQRGRIGILMLTGAAGLPERLEGLGAGADDYVTKPFEPRELLARVRSILRRLDAMPASSPAAAPPPRRTVRFGRATLHLDARRLTDEVGGEIPLTAMEYDLLAVFARHPRQVLSRDQLCRLAHNRELEAFDRSIDIRVTRLRHKLERDPSNPSAIRTVRGEGYVFEPDGSG